MEDPVLDLFYYFSATTFFTAVASFSLFETTTDNILTIKPACTIVVECIKNSANLDDLIKHLKDGSLYINQETNLYRILNEIQINSRKLRDVLIILRDAGYIPENKSDVLNNIIEELDVKCFKIYGLVACIFLFFFISIVGIDLAPPAE